jgi:hypothetical protein
MQMNASEDSVKGATFVFKYAFGLSFYGMGLLLFNREHRYASALISLPFFILGFFFLTVARLKVETAGVKYRRWFRWRAVSYSEICDCGESWVYGYIRTRQYVLPWGRIYFVRPHSSDSFFGWDKEVISVVRVKAHI